MKKLKRNDSIYLWTQNDILIKKKTYSIYKLPYCFWYIKKMNAAYIPVLLFPSWTFSCIHDIFYIDYSTCGGLIFQVYSVVDEMFLAGEIRETSQTKVLKQLLMLSSLEWSDSDVL